MSEKVLRALECSIISNDHKHLAKEAVSLSCGHLICKECLPLHNETPIKCDTCGQVNKTRLQTLRRMNESYPIECLLNSCLPNLFENLELLCKETFEQFKEIHCQEYLTLRMELLKEDIDIRVESLKYELDNLRDDLFGQLEKISSRIKLRHQPSEFNRAMKKHEELLKQIEESIKNIHQQTKSQYFHYQDTLKALVNDNKEYLKQNFDISFDTSNEQLKQSLIGKIQVPKPMDSLILDFILQYELLDLCNLQEKHKYKLLYRGSRDGFESNDFHSKCDNELKTLTVIRSSDNYIFGGYTSQKWDRKSGFKNYVDEYLFSLVNPMRKSIKIDGTRNKYAIHCSASLGPCFGNDDLYIKDANGYSYLGNCFYLSNLSLNGFNFTLKHDFLIDEIEVFKIDC